MKHHQNTLTMTKEDSSLVFFSFKEIEIFVNKKINISKLMFSSVSKLDLPEDDKVDYIILIHLLNSGNQYSKRLQRYVQEYYRCLQEMEILGYIKKVSKHSVGLKTNIYSVISEEDNVYDLRYENDFERRILERFAKVYANKKLKDVKTISYEGVHFDPLVDIPDLLLKNVEDSNNRSEYMNMVRDIENNTVKVNKNFNCGRTFSTFNRLPKFLRMHLQKNNKPLVEIDVTACHPNLLKNILVEEIDLIRKRNIFCEKVGSKGLVIGDNIDSELFQYSILLEGDFYNNFIEHTGINITRDALKKSFLSYLNSGSSIELKGDALEISKCFYSKFPGMSGVIKIINSRISIDSRKRYKQNYLSLKLQKLESKIMEQIVSNLMFINKDVVIIGVHDALLTEHDFLPIAYGETLRVFSLFGIDTVSLEIKVQGQVSVFQPSKTDFPGPSPSLPILPGISPLRVRKTCLRGEKTAKNVTEIVVQNCSLRGEENFLKERKRHTSVRSLPNGKFRIKVKGVVFESRKDENKEQFVTRVKENCPGVLIKEE